MSPPPSRPAPNEGWCGIAALLIIAVPASVITAAVWLLV